MLHPDGDAHAREMKYSSLGSPFEKTVELETTSHKSGLLASEAVRST